MGRADIPSSEGISMMKIPGHEHLEPESQEVSYRLRIVIGHLEMYFSTSPAESHIFFESF
jgi:hypothetical protein